MFNAALGTYVVGCGERDRDRSYSHRGGDRTQSSFVSLHLTDTFLPSSSFSSNEYPHAMRTPQSPHITPRADTPAGIDSALLDRLIRNMDGADLILNQRQQSTDPFHDFFVFF